MREEERQKGIIPLLKDHAQIAGGLAALATVVTSVVGLLWDRGGGDASNVIAAVSKTVRVEIAGAQFGSRLDPMTNDIQGNRTPAEGTIDICAPASLYGVASLRPESDVEVTMQWLLNNVLVDEQEYIVPAGDGRISLELVAPEAGAYSLRLHSKAADKSQSWRVLVRCEQRSRFSGATAEFSLRRDAAGYPVGATFMPDTNVEICRRETLYGFVYFEEGPATSAEIRWYEDGKLLGGESVRLEPSDDFLSYDVFDVSPVPYTLQLVVPSTNEAFSWDIYVRCATAPAPSPTPEASAISRVRFGAGEYEVAGKRIESGGEVEACAPSSIYADVDIIGADVDLAIEWFYGSQLVYENEYLAEEPGFYSPYEDPSAGVYTYRLTDNDTGETRSWTLRVRC